MISTFVLWLPFLFRSTSWFGLPIPNASFLYIYRHFDGLLYIISAKTLYNPDLIGQLKIELPLSPNYFAAHFPLYPLLIRSFASVFGYLKSMIFVNLFSTFLLASFFYYMVSTLKLTQKPLLLTTIFLFLPRFLILRSIGAPESLFILLILMSLFFFERKNYFAAGLVGLFAVTTKSPGILLFPAYLLVFAEEFIRTKKFQTAWFNILLIPVGLLGVFTLYGLQYGDFFAYFKSGDNFHLLFPFAVFNANARWVGSGWLEDILFYFFLYLSSIFALKDSKYRSFFYFTLVYFGAVLLVQHRDIARYALPLWPLAVISFERLLTSKKFLTVAIILLPAIYFYAWNFMTQNTMPVSDWSAFF